MCSDVSVYVCVHIHVRSYKHAKQRVVDNPNYYYCDGAYEMAVHYQGECDWHASLRREIWWKPHLYPILTRLWFLMMMIFRYLTVGDLASFIIKSRRFP